VLVHDGTGKPSGSKGELAGTARVARTPPDVVELVDRYVRPLMLWSGDGVPVSGTMRALEVGRGRYAAEATDR
jgi:hypothetical protein